MSTYRERREARAERLRDWADKREAKAEATLGQAHAMADGIPFGQPILVGHHSERADRNYRDRIGRTFERGVEHARKAEGMSSRAANIEAQLAGAIYSDDPDAIEALQVRLAVLEAERDRVKAYNASCRKGTPDTSVLDEQQRRQLAGCLRFGAYQCKGGAFPSYHLTNLSANISRNRKRLEALQKENGS